MLQAFLLQFIPAMVQGVTLAIPLGILLAVFFTAGSSGIQEYTEKSPLLGVLAVSFLCGRQSRYAGCYYERRL